MEIVNAPRVFPGRCVEENRGAVSWGRGLVAYGCGCYVVIASPATLEIVQTLDDHHANVTAVAWFVPKYPRTVAQNDLFLASADTTGTIVVWNALDGSIVSALRDVPHCVDKIAWHPEKENILVSLHHSTKEGGGGFLAMWDTKKCALLWCSALPELVAGLSLDFSPFDSFQIAFSSVDGGVYIIDGISDTVQAQQRIVPKYCVTNPRLKKGTNDLRQFVYSPHVWRICYFLFGREIVAFDTFIGRRVGTTPVERNQANFQEMFLCRDNPNLLFTLHDDGSMSAWKRKPDTYKFEMCASTPIMHFMKKGQKNHFVCSVAMSPVDSHTFVSVSSQNLLWIWKYDDLEGRTHITPEEIVTHNLVHMTRKTSMISVVAECETFRPASCISIYPEPVDGSYICASGSKTGILQICNLVKFHVRRTIEVAEDPIVSVEWIDKTKMIVGTVRERPATAKGAQPTYISNVYLVDITSGAVRTLRTGREASTYIVSNGIKVSPHKQFASIAFTTVIELWDLEQMKIFKSVRFPLVVSSVCWLESKSYFEDLSTDSLSMDLTESSIRTFVEERLLISLQSDSPSGLLSSTLLGPGASQSPLKCCVVSRKNVTVNDLGVNFGISVNALNCRGPLICGADSQGVVSCWNSRTKTKTAIATHKGPVASLSISTGNRMFVVFRSGEFGVWDVASGSRLSISTYFQHRGILGLCGGWIGENPVVLCTDQCLRILEPLMSSSTGKMQLKFLERPYLSPSVMQPQHALLVKSLLLNLNKPGLDEENMKIVKADVPAHIIKSLKDKDTLEACIELAMYTESPFEQRFWNLVKRAIPEMKTKRERAVTANTTPQPIETEGGNIISLREPAPATKGKPDGMFLSNFGVNATLRDLEDSLSNCHRQIFNSTDVFTPELQKMQSNYDILAGRKDDALDALLRTISGQARITYETALKACVVAAAIGETTFHNTTKMIAGQLIAQGELNEGVQLLCLIGKTLDACNFLISENSWTDAAWLSGFMKREDERERVMGMWASFLLAEGHITRAVEVLLSLGDLHQVLHILSQRKCFELGAMLVRVLEEQEIDLATIPVCEHSRSLEVLSTLPPPAAVAASLNADYGSYLGDALGLPDLAAHYVPH